MKVVLLSTLLACAIHAEEVTIVLDFDGPPSGRAVAEMKHEFENVLKDSGVHFAWRTRSEAGQESFSNLVLVKFKGKCRLEPVGYLYDERGPLAYAHSADGELQPFAEVACDKVAAAARSAMSGGDYANSDLLLGRALGRVLAHEFLHIHGNSKKHDAAGVGKASLSGVELIAPNPVDK
jgi:hypothetical protein